MVRWNTTDLECNVLFCQQCLPTLTASSSSVYFCRPFDLIHLAYIHWVTERCLQQIGFDGSTWSNLTSSPITLSKLKPCCWRTNTRKQRCTVPSISSPELNSKPMADLGFTRGGALIQKGAPTYYLTNFSRKLHEIGEILGQRGAPHSRSPPLDPPL